MQYLLANDAWLLPNQNVSEDCLFLNIYIPRTLKKSNRKAVMIWIHGGGFTAGQGMLCDASYLSIEGDVIVVTINYRLGLFGFLSKIDDSAPGNFGLWDQHLAIKWVKENIADYGGDPNNITLFGESAGGYSVGMHIVSHMSRGLFHRAILESGTTLSPRALVTNALQVARRLGKFLNCTNSFVNTDSKLLISCLRTISAEDIQERTSDALRHESGVLSLINNIGPVMDGHFLDDFPENIIKNVTSLGRVVFDSVDLMAGTNNAEGGLFYFSLLGFQKQFQFNMSNGIPTEIVCSLIANSFARDFYQNNSAVQAAICHRYSVNDSSTADFLKEQGRQALNVYADMFFVAPTQETLVAHACRSKRKTYQYLFSKQPLYPWIQERPRWLVGANHAGELPFVFGLDAMYKPSVPKTKDEMNLSKLMMRYWTNFAKTGDPNGPLVTSWKEFSDETRYYLNLSINSRTMTDLWPDRLKLWLEDIPDILKQGRLSNDGFINLDTRPGRLKGIVNTVKKEKVFQFRRVPYAKPPIGELRFSLPVPSGNWANMLDATQFGPSCIQYLIPNDAWLLPNQNISEDCLFLNIYIPRALCNSNKKAVMIWIHGGGYEAGQGMLFDASYLSLEGDVIVVTINYRLGLFGFLSTMDDSAPGNFGLWDQHLAIKWVKENIADYGGDPNNITIFGESAGGHSVGMHIISPESKGLFQRAISESGTTLIPSAFVTNALQVAQRLGQILNCTNSSIQMETRSLIACLRARPAKDILEKTSVATRDESDVLNLKSSIGPVVDGIFIDDFPENTIKNKSSKGREVFDSVDLMAGTNNDEGGIFYFTLLQLQKQYQFNLSEGMPTRLLCGVIADSFTSVLFQNISAVRTAICDKYTVTDTSRADFLEEQGRQTLNIVTDISFAAPTRATLAAHASESKRKTYQYLFSKLPLYPWIQERPSWLKGANHAGELPFVFGLDAMYKPSASKTTEEIGLSKLIMTYWTNYAKTGDPNGARLPQWDEFSNLKRHYMNLSLDSRTMTDLWPDRMKLWLEDIPDILSRSKRSTEKAPISSGVSWSLHMSATLTFVIIAFI
ncbi:hypothetical protein ACJMK2_016742 [Sinanodonta woodiana]|uniref:Carboxylesterase type B domain-containing protein n=1 Tax=Sinanodonta woodiana TaxID=1069815 RepID=A0ABD3UY48_SINWO